MTLQEIFTKVANHLLTQNAVSLDPQSEGCAYRGAEGRMCAVGCLITDSAYDPAIENMTPSTKAVKAALAKSGIDCTEHVEDLLQDLQSMHDSTDPSFWKEELEDLAATYNLEMP